MIFKLLTIFLFSNIFANEIPELNFIGNLSTNEDIDIDVVVLASDNDNDSLIFTINCLGDDDLLISSCTSTSSSSADCTFDVQDNQNGVVDCTVTVDDSNGGTDSETFTFTVNEVNDDPELDLIGDNFTDEDNDATITVLAIDVDIDENAQSLTFNLDCLGDDDLLISSCTSTSSSSADCTFDVQDNQNGVVDCTVTVDDSNGGTDSETFTFTVNEVNDVPTLNLIGNRSMDEDDELVITLEANDVEGNSIFFSESIDNFNVQLVLNNNLLSVIPNQNWNGYANITIVVRDDVSPNESNFETFTIEVLQVNDKPVIEDVFLLTDDQKFEDDINIQYSVTYTDVDSDIDLNYNPFDLNNVTWDIANTENLFSTYYDETNSFMIDSLRSNWNGDDSLRIIVIDDGNLSDTSYLNVSIQQVIDKPILLTPFFSQENNNTINEDTTNTIFRIPYEYIDADPDLNKVPLGIQDIIVDDSHPIFQNIFKDSNEGFDYNNLYQDWIIANLHQNWNGQENLQIIINAEYDNDILSDTILFPVTVRQVNDLPESFLIETQIEVFGIDSTSYYYHNDDSLFYRYPFVLDLPEYEQTYYNFLLHWNRTTDVDTDSTLNNDQLKELFYRIELYSESKDSIYVLKDKIKDTDFNDNDYCSSILSLENICDQYNFLTNTQYAYSSIDLKDSVVAYPDSMLYDDIDFGKKFLLDINGETIYKWRIVAYNDEKDIYGSDVERIVGSNDKSFLIDLTLPTSKIEIVQNYLYSEYFDMYLIPSEDIFNFDDLNQPLSVFLEPITPRPEYIPEQYAGGIYHLASAFSDTGNLYIKFEGRDRSQNFGYSNDTVRYQIITPNADNTFLSHSGKTKITVPNGAVNQEIGVVIREGDFTENLSSNNRLKITKDFYISPSNLSLNSPATIEFELNQNLLENYDFEDYNIQIFKFDQNEWLPLYTSYQNGIAITQTQEFGFYAVFINLDNEEQEFSFTPNEFDLNSVYPNPFNPVTNISINIPIKSKVSFSVFNLNGELIDKISAREFLAGKHSIQWNASKLPSGVYFIRMDSNTFTKAKKVILLK